MNTLTTKLGEVHEIKVKVQELKFESGEQTKDIEAWNSKLEGELFKVEAHIAEFDNTLKRINQKEIEVEKFKEEEIAAKARQIKFEEELQLEQAKLEQKLKYEKKMDESRKSSEHNATKTTKLPKLVISKFNGSFTDWTRFWEQYQAGIGASDIGRRYIWSRRYVHWSKDCP